MVRFLQSHTFAGLLGMALYLGVTVWCWPPLSSSSVAPRSTSGATPQARLRGPSWEFSNPDVDLLISELNKEKSALAERARQLNELATRLEAERLELQAVTQNVHQLQRDLDEILVRVSDEETANLKKLGKIYATMSPEGAAGILKQIDEGSIVKILLYMKDAESAPILEALARLGDTESKLAATLSERLRLAVFRKPAAKPRS